MADHKKLYYEQQALWDENYLVNSAEKERIEETIKIIPAETQTILDVGCGNGTFVNALISTFPDRFEKIVALDTSEEALRYVKTCKYKSSIVNLPFEDESFDLVTATEVLEHLSYEDFKRGILELQRVSKKSIVISVPFNEDLASSLVKCPQCSCWFSPIYHVRNFNKKSLGGMFDDFELIEVKEIGPIVKKRTYNRLWLSFYRTFRNPVPHETAICPQCGYQHKGIERELNNETNTFYFSPTVSPWLKNLANFIVSTVTKKKPWLLALYQK
ncbi:MAG: class I SAM-dependent methyltransferase [Planctomycetota bacterium]